MKGRDRMLRDEAMRAALGNCASASYPVDGRARAPEGDNSDRGGDFATTISHKDGVRTINVVGFRSRIPRGSVPECPAHATSERRGEHVVRDDIVEGEVRRRWRYDFQTGALVRYLDYTVEPFAAWDVISGDPVPA
jgi:hypothetical protein